jgi:hypothetical protein
MRDMISVKTDVEVISGLDARSMEQVGYENDDPAMA